MLSEFKMLETNTCYVRYEWSKQNQSIYRFHLPLLQKLLLSTFTSTSQAKVTSLIYFAANDLSAGDVGAAYGVVDKAQKKKKKEVESMCQTANQN